MSGVDPVKDWAIAKDEYFALTRVKKPREKVATFFRTSHTGLSNSINAIAGYDKLKVSEKTPAKYLKLKTEFEKASSNYISLLTKLIDEEDEKTVVEYTFGEKTLEVKKIKTNMYRGLKMLKAKLDNYSALYDYQYDLRLHMEANTEKVEKLEAQFTVLMKNGLKRFVAAAQAIKTTPTVEVWNREIGANDGVRSLTTALGTFRAIEKELEKTNTALTHEQNHMLQVTSNWTTQLSPWANGNRKRLDEGEDVLAELKQVSGIVKQCQAALNL